MSRMKIFRRAFPTTAEELLEGRLAWNPPRNPKKPNRARKPIIEAPIDEPMHRASPADQSPTAERLAEVGNRIVLAVNNGFYIEALALRLQAIDYWLRVYLASEPSNQRPAGKTNFGPLVAAAIERGFGKAPNDLAARLSSFTQTRNDAIHHFVSGATSYEAVGQAVLRSNTLYEEVMIFVLETAGIDAWPTPPLAQGVKVAVGDFALDWKEFSNQQRNAIGLPPIPDDG